MYIIKKVFITILILSLIILCSCTNKNEKIKQDIEDTLNITEQKTKEEIVQVTEESEKALQTEPHNHIFDLKIGLDKYLKFKATCTAAAEYYYSCTCGEKGTETFIYGTNKEHLYNIKNTSEKYLKSAATCTTVAEYYYSCSCGENCENTFLGEKFAQHSYTEECLDSEYWCSDPTCTEPDYWYYSCSCGAMGTKTFTTNCLLPHSEKVVIENKVDATCIESGSYDSVKYCEECGVEIDRTKTIISAKNHSWSDLVVQSYPTDTVAGEAYIQCESCSTIKEEYYVLPCVYCGMTGYATETKTERSRCKSCNGTGTTSTAVCNSCSSTSICTYVTGYYGSYMCCNNCYSFSIGNKIINCWNCGGKGVIENSETTTEKCTKCDGEKYMTVSKAEIEK